MVASSAAWTRSRRGAAFVGRPVGRATSSGNIAAISLPFILASLTIGVLVSVFARTTGQAIFLTVFFTMPSFVLSGSMLPYQLMPHGVREVGALFPLRWYQISLRRIVERGGGLVDVAVPGLALFLLFTVLILVVRARMKPRLG